MHYTFATESFHTEKLYSRLFFDRNTLFVGKTVTLCFAYAVDLRLIRKLLVDFLLAII